MVSAPKTELSFMKNTSLALSRQSVLAAVSASVDQLVALIQPVVSVSLTSPACSRGQSDKR